MERVWAKPQAVDHRGCVALIVALLSSVIVVPETEQAVVVRTGEPVARDQPLPAQQPFGQTGAGIWCCASRSSSGSSGSTSACSIVDMERQQVLSTDQLRLEVDAYARFRIIDPVQMVETAGTTERVDEQLQPILSFGAAAGARQAQLPVAADRRARRGDGEHPHELDAQAREYGAQVIDVRIKRADLPDGTPLESRVPRGCRPRASRKPRRSARRARRTRQIIRAEAEAMRPRPMPTASARTRQFYDFYRAMQSYDYDLRAGRRRAATIILSPDNDYLQQFRGTGA